MAQNNGLHDLYQRREHEYSLPKQAFDHSPSTPPKEHSLAWRIVKRVALSFFLVALVPLSFVLPMIGIPLGVLMFYSWNRFYAMFPILGSVLLVVYILFQNLMILITA